VFLGAFGFAAIIYLLVITRHFFVEAKRNGLVDRIPLAPILAPAAIWLVILSGVSGAILFVGFLHGLLAGYVLGMVWSLIQVLGKLNSPVNRQEVMENNQHYLKSAPSGKG